MANAERRGHRGAADRYCAGARIVEAEHGRTLRTGRFDSAAVGAPAVSGDSIVVLDRGGTSWAVRA
ncbi:hypothetical protein ACFW3D_19890 [Streptomyces sp. NPDC058864]